MLTNPVNNSIPQPQLERATQINTVHDSTTKMIKAQQDIDRLIKYTRGKVRGVHGPLTKDEVK